MASENAKKYARYVYKIFFAIHWILCLAMTALTILAICFARDTSGYYGGALAVWFMLLVISIQTSIILKRIKKHDKNEHSKRTFADTFNWQGYFIILSFGACIAGIATGVAIGAQYGKNHNETDTSQDGDYINKEENRIIGILIAILSGITGLFMVRVICLHGEIRGLLGIPEKIAPEPAPAPQPAPTPKPADQPKPETSKPKKQSDRNAEGEIEILTTQNNLLKEQNRMQKELLEQMTALNANLQQLSAARQPGPVPPPPDYQSLDLITPPGYVLSDTNDPPPGNKK